MSQENEGIGASKPNEQHGSAKVQDQPKIVKHYACPNGENDMLVVTVVEVVHQTANGKITLLEVTNHRKHVTLDGKVEVLQSYRNHQIPVLTHLLSQAYAFILSKSVAESGSE